MRTEPYRITVDKSPLSFSCAPGDTLLRAALRAGVGFSYECNAGSCGSCKVELREGDVEDLWPEAPGLGERDRARGRRLACQSVPRTDCVVKARVGDSYLGLHAPRRREAVLVAVRAITHDIRAFSFRSAQPALFQSGQYAMLRVPGRPACRAYSMSGMSNPDGLWEFMVRRTPGGALSNALFELEPGETIELDGPYGLAFLREESPRDIVCVAGGSGIAPMVSILRAASRSEGLRSVGASLFYGGRGPADVPALDTILPPESRAPGLTWCPVVSESRGGTPGGWSGEVGLVHEMLPRMLAKPLPEYEFYFAGPPPMIEATVRLLVLDHKVPTTQLHYDRFF